MLTLQRFSYSPILGWSNTRYATFSSCLRRYFYQYYGKHDTEVPFERIDILKKLASAPQVVGHLSHEVISAMLKKMARTGAALRMRPEHFPAYVQQQLDEHLADHTLMETYYGQEVDRAAMRDAIVLCLTNFMRSERFAWFARKALKSRKDWLIEPDGYGETRISALKAYCKVDFLFPVDRKLYIFDWKTGRVDEAKHIRQISGYAAWASFHFDRDPEEIITLIAYLKPEYREQTVSTITSEDLKQFAEMVEQETAEMYSYCSAVETNTPKAKSIFAKTDNLAFCRHCNFRELCGR